ncbi:MAG: hypothetical protein RMJ28_04250 [Nitrososphaerota archaeon]|nr:hypothetical protein [Candidatus Calditenuaceae archaeon]MDW8073432.1 hypothetical protein [Nitrososphaerota archaeon]
MKRLPFAPLLVAAILAASLPPVLAGQDCLRTLAIGESVEGELRGPENSGETHIYCVKAEKGQWLSVRVEMYHKELLNSRIITGLSQEGGGFLLYSDEILPSGGQKSYLYSWYVTGNEGSFRIILTSVAARLAPSVVGYRVFVSVSSNLDAELVQVKSELGSETYSLKIGDAPGEVYAPENLPELPSLSPGKTLTLAGHLSANVVKEVESGAELYGGRDTGDIYILPVDAPANSRLNITVKPPPKTSLLVVLRSEDGAALTSASSKRPGEPASIATVFNKAVRDGRLLVDIQLLKSENPDVAYSLELVLTEPPKTESEVELKPPFPESQARTLVIGFSATVIAVTVASVVIGWFRRRPERQPAYYW